jgi:methoxymalonate biosynthesis protein
VGGLTVIKCLVWDLDETLWQGTLLEGDDVKLSPDVLKTVRGLDERGVLQSVASRNDHDLAWSRLEELGVAELLVVPRIGWGRKSDSVRAIADELGFAHSAMGFVDDQPSDRAEVAFHLPEVRCYAAEQAPVLLGLPELSPAVVTQDARSRRRMYRAGFQRKAARQEFTGADDEFLRSLAMTMRISKAEERDLYRLEELTLRTSQMNATGVHYSDRALRALLADPGHEVLIVTLDDRFGPHGAVGVALLEKHPATWHLKLLATSCRVVPFGAGSVLLRWLVDQAVTAGVHLVADFRRTDRNRIMEIAYRFAGFSEQPCACQATITAVVAGGLSRLHLSPAPQCPPDTMQVRGPDLRWEGAGAERVWARPEEGAR